MSKTSEILIKVELDEENLPTKIEWDATDSGNEKFKESLAFMLSFWDKEEKVLLGLDLWTKDMMVNDMNNFFYQNFVKLADMYKRATHNENVILKIQNFADEFGKAVFESEELN
ncbi:MAG: gliding motility protein GldC [Bacteroidota bacterium]|nr:gliding motility protein GldC [Bacteroidota bacterium]